MIGSDDRALVDTYHDKIRETVVDGMQDELRRRTHLDLANTRLFAGKVVLHVLSDACPEPGFERAVPDLEDVYFATLKKHAFSGQTQGDIHV